MHLLPTRPEARKCGQQTVLLYPKLCSCSSQDPGTFLLREEPITWESEWQNARLGKASAERSTVIPSPPREAMSQMPCERQGMVSVRGNPVTCSWGDSPARNSWITGMRVSRYLRWPLLSQRGTLPCPINVTIHTHTHIHTRTHTQLIWRPAKLSSLVPCSLSSPPNFWLLLKGNKRREGQDDLLTQLYLES